MSRNRHGMVRWHNPVQLLRTGIEIFVSQELNARADLRLLEVQTGSDPDFTRAATPSATSIRLQVAKLMKSVSKRLSTRLLRTLIRNFRPMSTPYRES